MPTEILIVRHGQTQSNLTGYYMGWSDEDLSPEGLIQARKVCSRLSAVPIVSVYSSPLQRALSTAREIARPHNLKLRVEQDLIEINIGDWQGLHISEIRQRWPEQWHQWRTDPSAFIMPGGESFIHLAERVSRALKTITTNNLNSISVIVAHEIIVKIIIIQSLEASYSIYRHFEIGNASLSRIQAREDWFQVITVNDNAHLDS